MCKNYKNVQKLQQGHTDFWGVFSWSLFFGPFLGHTHSLSHTHTQTREFLGRLQITSDEQFLALVLFLFFFCFFSRVLQTSTHTLTLSLSLSLTCTLTHTSSRVHGISCALMLSVCKTWGREREGGREGEREIPGERESL